MNKLLTTLCLACCSLVLVCCNKDDDDPITTMSEVYHYGDATTSITLPTAFTPNKDGLNDVFRPLMTGTRPANYTFTVYTLDGRQIYQTTIPNAGWDAYNPATFVYYTAGNFRASISFTPAGGNPVTENFFFTILPYDTTSKCWKTNGRTYYFEDQIDPVTGAVARPVSAEILCPQ